MEKDAAGGYGTGFWETAKKGTVLVSKKTSFVCCFSLVVLGEIHWRLANFH